MLDFRLILYFIFVSTLFQLKASGEIAERFKLSYFPDFAETVEFSFKLGPNFFRRRSAFGK